MTACTADQPPPMSPGHHADAPLDPSRVVWSTNLSELPRCEDETVEVLVPYLEGLRFHHPARALAALGNRHVQLAYPVALSMPFVAYTCDGKEWHAVYPDDMMQAPPAEVVLKSNEATTELRFECLGACRLRTLTVQGTWRDLAREVAKLVPLPKYPRPLAQRFHDMKYFVQQWLPSPDMNSDKPLRVDWDVPSLVTEMRHQRSDSIMFLYGLDPGAVDLEGHYLWSPGAEKAAREILGANPALWHEFWLNLRTYKYAIPQLGIQKTMPPDVLDAARVYKDGPHENEQYGFRWREMCLGSARWQAMRMAELKHLVEVGFRIIALDEFPLGTRWDSAPCVSRTHLHKPGDFADEWRITLEFVKSLSLYAREHGVLLTSEEPSTALLPFASGYTDGAFNTPLDVMYQHWSKTPDIERVPLFSTMFGSIVTPYTRPDFHGPPPAGWIAQYKVPHPP